MTQGTENSDPACFGVPWQRHCMCRRLPAGLTQETTVCHMDHRQRSHGMSAWSLYKNLFHQDADQRSCWDRLPVQPISRGPQCAERALKCSQSRSTSTLISAQITDPVPVGCIQSRPLRGEIVELCPRLVLSCRWSVLRRKANKKNRKQKKCCPCIYCLYSVVCMG